MVVGRALPLRRRMPGPRIVKRPSPAGGAIPRGVLPRGLLKFKGGGRKRYSVGGPRF
jgi:hypothetical protein